MQIKCKSMNRLSAAGEFKSYRYGSPGAGAHVGDAPAARAPTCRGSRRDSSRICRCFDIGNAGWEPLVDPADRSLANVWLWTSGTPAPARVQDVCEEPCALGPGAPPGAYLTRP